MRNLIPDFILKNYAIGKLSGSFSAVGLFLDISGFSDMTEALMIHGQHGAELLAQVMCDAFTPLIRSVFEQGGFIATQAGDAFTAIFPAESDLNQIALRALSSAWNIQSTVSSRSHHTTPEGDFSISAKVGLALGEVNWGILTSQDQRKAAYYFQGTAVDGCAEAEGNAQAGEVILNSEIATLAGDQISVEEVGDHYRLIDLLAEPPDPIEIETLEVDIELAGRFLPGDLFNYPQRGEFRLVTYLFISLPTIRTAEQLELFLQTVFELQSQYGGLLKLLFGDKGAHLLLFWGAPLSYENDIARALNFILELQARTAIPVNGGITHRIAHVGMIGSDLAEEYTAYGQGVNLAARFMTSAPRGEIWLDEFVAHKAQGLFELEFLKEKSFKGFAEPQKVYALLERKEQTEIEYSGALVGRDVEIASLANFVQPIFEGNSPGILVVWGEPGVGKSRLIHDFFLNLQQASARDYELFLAQSDEILRESLNPFRYWLKTYFGVSESMADSRNKRSFNRRLDELIAMAETTHFVDELDRTRSFLGALVGLRWQDSLYEQLDAEARFENTLIGLTTLLLAESQRQPVIIFLEDAHWLDEDSKIFLQRFSRSLNADESRSYSIAIIITARLEGAGLPLMDIPYQRIDLGGLSRSDLALLAETHLGGPVSVSLLDFLEERAEGNPFFAEQIIRFLDEEGLLATGKAGWEMASGNISTLPMEVRAVLVSRMDRLAQDIKKVVQTAAVLGREFEVLVLAEMLRDDLKLSDKLLRAEQASVLAALNELRYIFSHSLLRDAAYSMQVHAQRQSLHELAFSALEQLHRDDLAPHYAELAFHAERANLVDKARHYLRLAGEAAQDSYQNSLAADYYCRALDITPEEDFIERFDLLLKRIGVYELLGLQRKRKQDLEELEVIAKKLGDTAKQARVVLEWASYAHDKGEFIESIKLAEESIALAPEAKDIETELQARAFVAIGNYRLAKYEVASQQARSGLDLARKAGDRVNESRLLNNLGLATMGLRELDLARQFFEEAYQIAVEIGNLRSQASTLSNLGMVANYQGDHHAEERYLKQSLENAKESGSRSGEGRVLGNLGFLAGSIGEYEQSKVYHEQSLSISREIGDLYMEIFAYLNLSSTFRALGDLASALHNAEQAWALALQLDDESSKAWALTYKGHSLFDTGRFQEAAAAYQAAMDIRYQLEQPHLATEPIAGLARVALAHKNIPAAEGHIEVLTSYLADGGTFEGTDEPLRVYLTCFQVLQEAGNPSAGEILKIAYNQLQERASSFKDAEIQNGFLKNIAHNREILAAWEKTHPDTPNIQ